VLQFDIRELENNIFSKGKLYAIGTLCVVLPASLNLRTIYDHQAQGLLVRRLPFRLNLCLALLVNGGQSANAGSQLQAYILIGRCRNGVCANANEKSE
jgi:hypothetical protein